MIDPIMKATPAQKKSRWVTSTAAARLSAKPTIEIAFGVSLDSIRRSRARARNSWVLRIWRPLRARRGALGGAGASVIGGGAYACASLGAVVNDQTSGRIRARRQAITAESAATSAPAAASIQEWLA